MIESVAGALSMASVEPGKISEQESSRIRLAGRCL